MTVPLINLESYDLLQMEMKAEHLDGLHALSARDKTLGLATLCIGGGEAVAMAIEMV